MQMDQTYLKISWPWFILGAALARLCLPPMSLNICFYSLCFKASLKKAARTQPQLMPEGFIGDLGKSAHSKRAIKHWTGVTIPGNVLKVAVALGDLLRLSWRAFPTLIFHDSVITCPAQPGGFGKHYNFLPGL